jgi:DNA-binding NtrC family response regulator
VFDIPLPALRDRLSDVPLLAAQFLTELRETSGGVAASLADEARDILLAHTWPGNVRELRNVLERAAIMCDDGVIEPQHLSLHAKAAAPSPPNDLGAMERQAIENVLRQTDGNKAKAARKLGLTRTQLYVRLRRYGLEHSTAM